MIVLFKKTPLYLGAIFLFMIYPSAFLFANEPNDFIAWRNAFVQEAQEKGIHQSTIESALPLMEEDPEVIALDRRQPEKTITFLKYQKNTLTDYRVEKGRALSHAWANVLDRATITYGVPPSVILSLWGMESGFGANMGDFSVIRSLTTLAFEGRRASFFRNELFEALALIQEDRIDPEDLTGSWAGAMGQCQFMPSTYRRFAIDGDSDGRRDIWTNETDVIYSIAHYLASEGWARGQHWGTEVSHSIKIDSHHYGLETTHPIREWSHLGVSAPSHKKLAPSDSTASLVRPDAYHPSNFS